ncbi:MAG: 3-hydroxyacyl-ACP dehydratase FabZ [Parvibaculum sp.]|jgi:3-hydroxyacyl-[acyl-carrier-protein] dehydratase|uniref:3-hydroxyacyl-ACP dehydratase FabZ n=1 Tax=Parvibaculum sp. TaxID=2024848 RepID=UPI003C759B8A
MSEAQAAAEKLESADIKRVMELLPHRYPMLMIDRIIEMRGNESAIGIKNVSNNEPFFQGHFPGHPVMPGVLIVEAMAQTAGALVLNSLGTGAEGKIVYFMSIERAKFRKPVLPGDVLHVHVSKIQNRGPVWKFSGQAKVEGAVVAEADFAAMIIDQASA